MSSAPPCVDRDLFCRGCGSQVSFTPSGLTHADSSDDAACHLVVDVDDLIVFEAAAMLLHAKWKLLVGGRGVRWVDAAPSVQDDFRCLAGRGLGAVSGGMAGVVAALTASAPVLADPWLADPRLVSAFAGLLVAADVLAQVAA